MIFHLKKSVLLLFLITSTIFAIDVDLDRLVSDVNKTKKPIMLFLHKDGCGFCEKMVFNFENKKLSTKIAKEFTFVDINRDDDETILFQGQKGTNRAFLKKLGVDFYPITLFMDERGSFVYTLAGYRNPKKLTSVLNYISSKSYKKRTFEEFEDESLLHSKSK